MNFSINIKWHLLLTSTAILLIAPDLAFWLIHALFELFHALLELIEVTLDVIVEHLFHTSPHTTQIIVFYLMWAMAFYPAYRLFRYCKRCVLEWKQTIPYWCKDKKEQAASNWQQQSLIKKCKIIAGCFLGAVGFSFLVF